jgi:hypothetical protein
MADPVNNDCFNLGNLIGNNTSPNTNTGNPIDTSDNPTDGGGNPVDTGGGNSTGSGNNTPDDNSGNNNGVGNSNASNSAADIPLYTPLTINSVISTDKKMLTMTVINYPQDVFTKKIFYDFTLITPQINYNVTKSNISNQKYFYNFLIKFYKSPGSLIFSDTISFFVKPIVIFTPENKKLTLNYTIPHYVTTSLPILNYNTNKVKIITIEVIDSDSDLDVDFISVDTSNKIFALSKL